MELRVDELLLVGMDVPEPLFAGSEDEVSVRKLRTERRRKSLRNEGMAAACRRGLGGGSEDEE